MTTKPGEGVGPEDAAFEESLTPRDQAILRKIREVARNSEEFEKLVGKYLRGNKGECE